MLLIKTVNWYCYLFVVTLVALNSNFSKPDNQKYNSILVVDFLENVTWTMCFTAKLTACGKSFVIAKAILNCAQIHENLWSITPDDHDDDSTYRQTFL